MEVRERAYPFPVSRSSRALMPALGAGTGNSQYVAAIGNGEEWEP